MTRDNYSSRCFFWSICWDSRVPPLVIIFFSRILTFCPLRWRPMPVSRPPGLKPSWHFWKKLPWRTMLRSRTNEIVWMITTCLLRYVVTLSSVKCQTLWPCVHHDKWWMMNIEWQRGWCPFFRGFQNLPAPLPLTNTYGLAYMSNHAVLGLEASRRDKPWHPLPTWWTTVLQSKYYSFLFTPCENPPLESMVNGCIWSLEILNGALIGLCKHIRSMPINRWVLEYR